MPNINRITIAGHLGRDPEIKYTSNNKAVARFSVAVSERQKVGDEWQDKTEWFSVVAWERSAEYAGKYLEKGAAVLVEGRVQTREYEKDGEKRRVVEVIASSVHGLSPRAKETDNEPEPAKAKKPNAGGIFDDIEESIPF